MGAGHKNGSPAVMAGSCEERHEQKKPTLLPWLCQQDHPTSMHHLLGVRHAARSSPQEVLQHLSTCFGGTVAVPLKQSCGVQVSMLPKQNGSRPRTVVFTQGADSTAVASLGKVRSSTTRICPKVVIHCILQLALEL